MRGKILSNAIWNVVNGSSSALIAVLVPPVLTRTFSPSEYSAWAIALQIGAYVGLFGFGVQIAVGRYVALCEAGGDLVKRDRIVSSAFWFLVFAATIAGICVFMTAIGLDFIVPDLPDDMAHEARATVLLVGFSLAISLPASAFGAVFIGLQRAEVPATIQGGGRVVLAVGLIAASASGKVLYVALVYAFVTIAIAAALWVGWRYKTKAPTISLRSASLAGLRELLSFCLSLMIWNISMLLFSGLDVIIVGRYDFAAVAFFSVGLTLSSFVAGVIGSFAQAMIPAAAKLSDDPAALERLLVSGFRFIGAVSLIVSAPLIFSGEVILSYWVGSEYAQNASLILALLAVSMVIRNLMLPYVMLAIGVGRHQKMTITPIAEGIASLIATLALVISFGADGVAAAKCIGGLLGVVMLIWQHALRRSIPDFDRRSYLLGCVARLLAAGVAASSLSALINISGLQGHLASVPLIVGAAAVSAWLILLGERERRDVRRTLSSTLYEIGKIVSWKT